MQKYNNLVRQTTFKSVFACYARQLYIPIYRLIKTNIINNTNYKQKRLDRIGPIFIPIELQITLFGYVWCFQTKTFLLVYSL